MRYYFRVSKVSQVEVGVDSELPGQLVDIPKWSWCDGDYKEQSTMYTKWAVSGARMERVFLVTI